MDLSTWLVVGLLPAAIMLPVVWVAGRTTTASQGDVTPPVRGVTLLALGWGLAVLAALVGRRLASGDDSFPLWPDDFWQRSYLSILLSAIILGTTAGPSWRSRTARWMLAGLLAMLTATVCLPAGSGWEDTLPAHQGWSLLLGSSCLLGFFSLDQLAANRSDRWYPLVLLAILAGPMFVAATTYSALAEWTLAAIFATLPVAAWAAIGRLRSDLAVGLAFPVVVFATSMMAAGRFYSFEDQPWWSYAAMMLAGPAVAAVDRLVRTRATGWRMLVAATVAIGVTAIGIAIQLRPTE